SNPDVRGDVPAGVAHLVRPGRAAGVGAEGDEEGLGGAQAAGRRGAVDPHHVGTLLGEVAVELVVPGTEQRVGYVQALAVEAELEHLRTTAQRRAVHRAAFADHATEPHLTGEPRL